MSDTTLLDEVRALRAELRAAQTAMASRRAITPKAVSPKDAATWLGVSIRTVDRLIETGELQSRRIGRLRRIPTHALDQFLRDRQASK